jgi:tetrahydromethanopterin S-methyltransferase subunit G
MNKTNKVSKNEYKNYVKAYQLKIKESDKTIREFKAPLVNTGGRIQEIVERLDFLETQMDNNKASLEILEDRYKKGKIPSKTTYQDLYNEIMKKQDKNKKEIDKLITELKAFLI